MEEQEYIIYFGEELDNKLRKLWEDDPDLCTLVVDKIMDEMIEMHVKGEA